LWLVGKKTATGKQPYAIALVDQRLMALAGLWETWRSPADERVRLRHHHEDPERISSELHNRMPVVLNPESWSAWLGEEITDPRDADPKPVVRSDRRHRRPMPEGV
jgi:putative SOS response-associated peptidase YedK